MTGVLFVMLFWLVVGCAALCVVVVAGMGWLRITERSAHREPHARVYDWAADQRQSDAQLTALAATLRALDERPALVRSLVDERVARASLGYPNVYPFIRKNDRPAL